MLIRRFHSALRLLLALLGGLALTAQALTAHADGLPDWADPYPADADNNTIYWEGKFVVDAMSLSLSGMYARSEDWADTDGDQLPNFLDPYPNDATNNTTAWSGTAYVDGALEELSAIFPTNSSSDADNDGIPDLADPYPGDSTNNTAFWNGGSFTIDGSTQYLNGDGHAYAPDADDADADGIPDFADPYPYDETNGEPLPEEPVAPAEDGTSTDGAGLTGGGVMNGTTEVPLGNITVPQINVPMPQLDSPVLFVEVPPPTVSLPVVDLPELSVPGANLPMLVNTALTPAPLDAGELAALALPELSVPMPSISALQAQSASAVMPHAASVLINLDGVTPSADDLDGDGLDDLTEALDTLTDPTTPDTDQDGLADGWELANGHDPLDPADGQADADSDGLSLSVELHEQTDPEKYDTDGGGIPDGLEVAGLNQLRILVNNDPVAVALLLEQHTLTGVNPLDPEDDQPKPAPAEEKTEPEPDPLPDVIIFPPEGIPYDEADVGRDNDGDGVLVPEDPDDNDPDVPNERDLDADGVGHKTDPNDNDPNIPNRQPPPPGEKLKDKLAREKQEKAEAHEKRNKELHDARKERQQARADARQAARDMNELLNHPHGNHGNGVKNPGTRGTRTDGNPNGALPFQPSESYAKTSAYQKQAWENRMFQHVRDTDSRLDGLSATERQSVLGRLSHDAKRAGINGDTDSAFAAQWISGQVGTIIDGAPQPGGAPQFGNGGNIFANRANAAAGGIGAAAGFGGGAFDPGNAGVGPDGATSIGADLDPYQGGTPSWHQPGTHDTDGDGVSNEVENAIGTSADNRLDTPTKVQQWNLDLKRREAAAAEQAAERARKEAAAASTDPLDDPNLSPDPGTAEPTEYEKDTLGWDDPDMSAYELESLRQQRAEEAARLGDPKNYPLELRPLIDPLLAFMKAAAGIARTGGDLKDWSIQKGAEMSASDNPVKSATGTVLGTAGATAGALVEGAASVPSPETAVGAYEYGVEGTATAMRRAEQAGGGTTTVITSGYKHLLTDWNVGKIKDGVEQGDVQKILDGTAATLSLITGGASGIRGKGPLRPGSLRPDGSPATPHTATPPSTSPSTSPSPALPHTATDTGGSTPSSASGMGGDISPGTRTPFGPPVPALNKAGEYGTVSGGRGIPYRIVEHPSTKGGVPPLREAYIREVHGLSQAHQQMLESGFSDEAIARTLHQMRRDIGVKYKDLTPPEELARITERNIRDYGDPLGPTIDSMRSSGKTWQQIIESAQRPGGKNLDLDFPVPRDALPALNP